MDGYAISWLFKNALISILYSVHERMINECGAAGEMRTGKESRSTWIKPAPVQNNFISKMYYVNACVQEVASFKI
jgi:hypothetical protein